MREIRTQVGIIGAGPAGLMLAHLLAREGIESVVVERRSREYVEQRVRAGVLEHSNSELLAATGVGDRMRREGLVHHGIEVRFSGERHRIPLSELASGRSLVVYGQQEVVKDLILACVAWGCDVRFQTEATGLENLDPSGGSSPEIMVLSPDGERCRISCKVVVGCDGAHGVSRSAMSSQAQVLSRDYPFAWLGVLAAAPPCSDELIYCRSDRGFALCSMRSPDLSRLYLQVAPGEQSECWTDTRIWDELRARLAIEGGWSLQEGPIIERSITTMRSVMVEPMRYGSLFLAGDAAHVVPPTGAKGMNLAIADVRDLAEALLDKLRKTDDRLADQYSTRALRRAWRAQEFSHFMTTMLHPFSDDLVANKLQLARLDHLVRSEDLQRWLADCYVDLTGS